MTPPDRAIPDCRGTAGRGCAAPARLQRSRWRSCRYRRSPGIPDIHSLPGKVCSDKHFSCQTLPRQMSVQNSRPQIGRGFRAGEDLDGQPLQVLLSHRIWRDEFASDPAILGRSVRLNGEFARVLGVMPEGFGFPSDDDCWVNMRLPASATAAAEGTVEMMGERNPGHPIAIRRCRSGPSFSGCPGPWVSRTLQPERRPRRAHAPGAREKNGCPFLRCPFLYRWLPCMQPAINGTPVVLAAPGDFFAADFDLYVEDIHRAGFESAQ